MRAAIENGVGGAHWVVCYMRQSEKSQHNMKYMCTHCALDSLFNVCVYTLRALLAKGIWNWNINWIGNEYDEKWDETLNEKYYIKINIYNILKNKCMLD